MEKEKCQHCGGETGYYTKDSYRGTCNMNYTFEGEAEDNGEMYDGAQHSYGKWAYCRDCGKRLFRVMYFTQEHMSG